MTEQWRPITGFEGEYEVSSCGRVRSLDRTVETVGRWGPMTRKISGQILNPNLVGNIYPRVRLGGKGKPWRYIHHLVAEEFIGPRPEGALVLHWDDVPTHNVPANLYYGSVSQNGLDAVRNDRHVNALKTHCPAGHEYSEGNVKLYKGRRTCRTCANERNRGVRPRPRIAA